VEFCLQFKAITMPFVFLLLLHSVIDTYFSQYFPLFCKILILQNFILDICAEELFFSLRFSSWWLWKQHDTRLATDEIDALGNL